MDPFEALDLVEGVCKNMVGTWEDHQRLHAALADIRLALEGVRPDAEQDQHDQP